MFQSLGCRHYTTSFAENKNRLSLIKQTDEIVNKQLQIVWVGVSDISSAENQAYADGVNTNMLANTFVQKWCLGNHRIRAQPGIYDSRDLSGIGEF